MNNVAQPFNVNGWDKIEFSGIKGILLDLDNSIYAYEECHIHALNRCHQLYSKLIKEISFEEFLTKYKQAQKVVKQQTLGTAASHSRLLYFQVLFEQEFNKTKIDITQKFEEYYWASFFQKMRIRPGMIEFLEQIKSRGLLVCILTNLTAQIQFNKVRHLGLERFIDYIVTSEEAGAEKPLEKMFSYALKKIGLDAEQVLMIGDDEKEDGDGARGCNIKYIFMGIKS